MNAKIDVILKMNLVLSLVLGLGLSLSPVDAKAKENRKPLTLSPSSSKSTTYSPVQESYFADFQYELQTATSGAVLQTYKARGDNYTVIDGQISLSKLIKTNIQVGGEVHLSNVSGGTSSSYVEFIAFGVYNLDNNLKESLYGKAGVGMLNTINDKGSNESKVGVLLGAGKRIPLYDKVTYTPEARLVLVDGTTRFQIVALNFSILY